MTRNRGTEFILITAACVCVLMAHAARGEPSKLPAGEGLAAKYPGDRGVERDGSVLLAERFDVDSVDALKSRWHEISNKNGNVLSLVNGGPAGSPGRCLQSTAHVDADTGGHLYRQLPRAVERAFARFYVRFPKDAGYIHHFVHFGGYHPATRWPQGGAGQRPRGDDRFTVGIEPAGGWGRDEPPGHWNFYCYWHEMKVSAGNKYWGNSLRPATPPAVPRDRWQCVEVMIQCNTPGQRDGELALWLDGKLTMHIYQGVKRGRWTGMGFELREDGEPFEGFSWRTSRDLKVNFFWLLHYVTEGAIRRNRVDDPPKTNTVFFDNIIVAEKYIGPIKPLEK